MINALVGFENDEQNGMSEFFNFILSNGCRSKQRDVAYDYYTHMMPQGTRVKSVDIYYHTKSNITGFTFFD